MKTERYAADEIIQATSSSDDHRSSPSLLAHRNRQTGIQIAVSTEDGVRLGCGPNQTVNVGRASASTTSARSLSGRTRWAPGSITNQSRKRQNRSRSGVSTGPDQTYSAVASGSIQKNATL